MRTKRVVFGVAGAFAALLVAAAALGWFVVGPSQVEERVRSLAARRFALAANVGNVELGWSRTHVEGLRLSGAQGGLTIEIDHVEVEGSLVNLALRGTEAVEHVHIDGVRIDVSAGEPGVKSIASVRAAMARGNADANSGGEEARSLASRTEVTDVTVRVADELGELVQITAGGLRTLPDGSVQLSFGLARLGTAPHDEVNLVAATLVLVEEEGARRVSSFTLGSGEAVWAIRHGADGDLLHEAAAGLDDSGSEAALVTRLGRFRRRMSTATDRARVPNGTVERPRDRFAKRASLTFGPTTVKQRGSRGDRTVVSGIRGTVALEEDRLELRGAGEPEGRGRLSWDLRVWPEELRAEGHVGFEELSLAVIAPFLPSIPLSEPELASVTGELDLDAQGAETIALRGRVEVKNASVSSSRIAASPVRGLGAAVEGEGVFHVGARRLDITRGRVSMGAAHVDFHGSLERATDHYVIDVSADLPMTPCDAALHAIPSDMLAEVAGFSWTGSVAGLLRLHVDSRALDETTMDLDVVDQCQFVTVPTIADLHRVEAPFLHHVTEPDGTTFEMTTGPGSGNWASIYEISPFLVHAVLAHEDGGFFGHHGFSTGSIREALVRNLREGRYVQGASTISMQLAKNLFLHREKTLARKVQEVILTWWLEKALPKERMLELYLNIIEYGPAVYGLRNAAMYYFGRDPSELSPAESAFLATILPAPKRYAAERERDSLSPSIANRMRFLLRHMQSRGRIDQAALDFGLAEIEHFRFAHGEQRIGEEREIAGEWGELPFSSGGGFGVEGWDEVAPTEERDDAPSDDGW